MLPIFCIRGESEGNRLRNQLNGEWHFKYENSIEPGYSIVLNRKHENSGQSKERKASKTKEI